MNGTDISKDEALKLIERVRGKTVKANLFYGGVLNLEIGDISDELITTPGGKAYMSPRGELSISIGGNWVISDKKEQIIRDDNTGSKDSIKIQNFIGNETIRNIDLLDDMKIVTISLSGEKEINVISADTDSDYFYMTSKDDLLEGLVLSSEFKFKKIPRN